MFNLDSEYEKIKLENEEFRLEAEIEYLKGMDVANKIKSDNLTEDDVDDLMDGLINSL